MRVQTVYASYSRVRLDSEQALGSGNGAVNVDLMDIEADNLVFQIPDGFSAGPEFAVAALEIYDDETAWGNEYADARA